MNETANRPMMSYEYARSIIAFHAGQLLPLFADGWERFPAGQNARKLASALRDEVRFWTGRNNEVASMLEEVAEEIEYRANSQPQARGGRDNG